MKPGIEAVVAALDELDATFDNTDTLRLSLLSDVRAYVEALKAEREPVPVDAIRECMSWVDTHDEDANEAWITVHNWLKAAPPEPSALREFFLKLIEGATAQPALDDDGTPNVYNTLLMLREAVEKNAALDSPDASEKGE